MIEAIQPYACRHDKELLRRELLLDKANDDGERSYTLSEDDPPETDLEPVTTRYPGPSDPAGLTEDDVYDALSF